MRGDNDVFPLLDEVDCLILMHRDVHFGGQFSEMIRYYESGRKGVQQEFELKRIYELAELEIHLQENLAALVLSGSDAELIARARQAYRDLRELYETKNLKNRYPILIADLILSEDENPSSEIHAIIEEGEKIVPELISLIRSEKYQLPLYPGYGMAPTLAAKCLGMIGDQRAIITLFESIGGDCDFFDEGACLGALKLIGEPAKEFLLQVVVKEPFNEDNQRAALALCYFKNDPEVSTTCFSVLKNLDIKNYFLFASYLAFACEGLKNTPYKDEFINFSKQSHIPKDLQKDMVSIIKDWD